MIKLGINGFGRIGRLAARVAIRRGDMDIVAINAPDKTPDMLAYLFAHVSFVRIHPFFDGNGRIARLLANLPVLCAGFPPIVVPSEARLDYISELWDYQRAVGVISLASRELLPEPSRLDNFRRLVRGWWRTTLDLVAEAKRK